MSTEAKVPISDSSSPAASEGSTNSVERILSVAYELFSRRGIRDVGVNELIDRSGVAKATFYRHFTSKDSLVLAFLEQRDKLWTVEAIVSQARRRGHTPVERMLSIFDVLGEWFQRDDFEGSTFTQVLLEMGPSHPLGQASINYLAKLRGHVQALAEEAGLVDPDGFARSWQILMKGSIISAIGGDLDAGKRARQMAAWLIEHHKA